MRIEKCAFCESPVYPGHGMLFVRNDAKLFRFCRSKCKKNFHLRRNPRRVRWTKIYRKAHGKEMTVDTSLQFERRVNEPVRYDRELYDKVIPAMRRIAEIRERRAARFHARRMRVNVALNAKSDIRDLQKHLRRVKEPTLIEEGRRALQAHQTRLVAGERTAVDVADAIGAAASRRGTSAADILAAGSAAAPAATKGQRRARVVAPTDAQ